MGWRGGRLGLHLKAQGRDRPVRLADRLEAALHDEGVGIEAKAARVRLLEDDRRWLALLGRLERPSKLDGRVQSRRSLVLLEPVGRIF